MGYALKQAQQAVQRAMDARLRPLGLSAARYAVLNAVDRLPARLREPAKSAAS